MDKFVYLDLKLYMQHIYYQNQLCLFIVQGISTVIYHHCYTSDIDAVGIV